MVQVAHQNTERCVVRITITAGSTSNEFRGSVGCLRPQIIQHLARWPRRRLHFDRSPFRLRNRPPQCVLSRETELHMYRAHRNDTEGESATCLVQHQRDRHGRPAGVAGKPPNIVPNRAGWRASIARHAELPRHYIRKPRARVRRDIQPDPTARHLHLQPDRHARISRLVERYGGLLKTTGKVTDADRPS